MVARYRRVSTQMWNDAKVRALSRDGKLLWSFVLTHQHITPLGMLRISPRALGDELQYSKREFKAAWAEILRSGMIEADEENCLVVLPNYMAHNPPENPNQVFGLAKWIPELPDCLLKATHLQRVKLFLQPLCKQFDQRFAKQFDELFRNGWGKGMPNNELELELELDTQPRVCAREDEHAKTEPPAFFNRIFDAYHELCPDLPKILDRQGRIAALKARCNEDKERLATEWWEGFFKRVHKSNFLCGRCPPSPGRTKPFKADIDWLLVRKNFIHILEGSRYVNEMPGAERGTLREKKPHPTDLRIKAKAGDQDAAHEYWMLTGDDSFCKEGAIPSEAQKALDELKRKTAQRTAAVEGKRNEKPQRHADGEAEETR